MKPEEKAEMILWDWLINNSSKVRYVYFNRKNAAAAKIFTTQGINRKPDFIIKLSDNYGIKYYAVEVKSSDRSQNVVKASKILDKYLLNYLDGKTKYYIDNKEISLSGFLIATDQSKKGYLFYNETVVSNDREEDGLSKFNAATKYKIIPLKEGARTFEYVRGVLWDAYSKFRKNYKKKLDVGILIGNSEDGYSPHIMITNFYNKKNRWTQRWWKI